MLLFVVPSSIVIVIIITTILPSEAFPCSVLFIIMYCPTVHIQYATSQWQGATVVGLTKLMIGVPEQQEEQNNRYTCACRRHSLFERDHHCNM